MLLTLFALLTYVSVLHGMVRFYYNGFLVNEGIGLILVIQTLYPSSLSVLLQVNMSTQPLLQYDPLLFLLLYLSHIMIVLNEMSLLHLMHYYFTDIMHIHVND